LTRSNNYVVDLLNRVGKEVFIKYYNNFKIKSNQECIRAITEPFTDKSKASRTSKAKRIFRENLHGQALKLIVESGRLDRAVISRAREIMNKEL